MGTCYGRAGYTSHMRTSNELLVEIYRLLPEVDARRDASLDASGPPPDLAGVRTGPGNPVEASAYRREALLHPLAELYTIATEAGRAPTDERSPIAYLLAERPDVPPAPLERVLRALNALLEPAAKPCPLNHEEGGNLEPTPRGYYCPQCGIERTEEDLNTLRGWIIKQADPLVTRSQASQLLGVPRGTLRVWIHRGRLTEHEGRLRLSDVRALLAGGQKVR